MDELLEQFVIEGRELVTQASSDLVALERNTADAALIDTLFRAFHTLKGSVALFDFAPMGRALHAAEDLLGRVRASKGSVDRSMIDALLECIDVSERWIETIARTEALPAGAEEDAARIAAALVAASRSDEGPVAKPDQHPWTKDLLAAASGQPETGETASALTAIRYQPAADSLLSGGDPVQTARKIPALKALRITPREPWSTENFDPYHSNLLIEALSGAPESEVRDALRSVADQTAIVALSPVATRAELSGPGPASAPAGVDNTQRTIRVDAARIDALVDLVGELIVAKNGLGHLEARAAEAGLALAPALSASTAVVSRLSADMHRAVMSMRMLPLARTFGRFPRWMRETAAKLGKDVEFDVADRAAEADKTVVDGLYEPLLHLLRNALDHGIELPDQRAQAGKPSRGRIRLEARMQGDQIEITVADDGRELNIDRIRDRVRDQRLLPADAIAGLDDAAAVDLIFMPGFTTADAVTDISGRGVGMDAVRTAIAALGGQVAITSTSGAGTSVQMTLPRAALVSTIVVIGAGDDRFGVPIEAVTETCRVPVDRILPIRDGEAFVLRNRTLPLVRLSALLRLPQSDRSGVEAKVLIVGTGNLRVGVEVDSIGDRLDVLLRPMAGLLSGMHGVLGTALLGDGSVLLVLDLPGLAA